MIAAVAVGLLIGVALGSLGGGGSILAVPVLVYLAGQSAVAATSTSLVAVGVASAVAAVGHARARRVRWDAAAAFLATGVFATWAGSAVSDQIDGDVVLLAFSGLVLVAAHRMLTACPSCTKVGEANVNRTPPPVRVLATPSRPPGEIATGNVVLTAPATASTAVRVRRGAAARVIVAGSIVGFLTGLFGVGGGFVIVPALTLALGLTLPTAIGTSLVIITGNAAIALAFRGIDSVDWSIASPFAATTLIGASVGAVLARRLPPSRSLAAFAVLLVAVALANGAAATTALLR
jgi:uncharacterized protein